MKTSNLVKFGGGIVAAALVAFAWQANATVVYSSSTGTGNQQQGPWVLGNDFTVNTGGGYVTAMGAFDDTSNGLGFGSTTLYLGIYDLGTSTLVPGTQVNFTGSAGTLINNYLYYDIADVYLAPGSYSIVAANYGATTEVNYNAGGGGPNPVSFDTVGGLLTAGYGRWVQGSALTLPSAQPGSPPAFPQIPLFGAGSFDFTPVPEAETFGAAAVGLLGLVYLVRQVRIRRKIALA